MVRAAASERGAGDEDDHSLPEDAAHIIVVGREFSAPAPADYPDSGFLTYENGDELPFEVGKRALPRHPMTLAALDEDGNVVAGGEGRQRNLLFPGPDGEGLPAEHSERLASATDRWRSGEGFDPTEADANTDGAED